MVFAGIDGGATHTRAALADDTGTLIGYGTAGPSNYDNIGVAAAEQNIRQAFRNAWQSAGFDPRPADGVFLGMAGVVSPADRSTIEDIARRAALAPDGCVGVDHDIRIALAGGLAGAAGMVLIAGTGSSCYGRTDDGRHHRTGWGYLLDDLGSGYKLGLEAMIAAVREADGRGRATSLTSAVRVALGYAAIDDIMRRLYHDHLSVTEIAALAPLVLRAAAQRDAVAVSIVTNGADDLAAMVYAVARSLGFIEGKSSVALAGGLALTSPLYKEMISAAVQGRLPGCSVVDPVLPPVAGAVLLAMQLRGRTCAADTVATLIHHQQQMQ